MIRRIAAGILLLFGGIAIVCVAVVYTAGAIDAALVPMIGPAWAAAATAGAFVLLILIGFAGVGLASRSAARRLQDRTTPDVDNVMLVFLAGLARERPLVAVLLAGVFGAASAVLRGGPKK